MRRSTRVPVMGLFGGIRLGRIAGIQITADWSLAIIFILIAFSLAAGVFPYWHPRWSPLLAWGTAVGAAVLFLASILAHELSHALVGQLGGVRVDRITLFMLGGLAQMENEPPTWRAELAMAAVGPVTSVVLGLLFSWLAVLVAGPIRLTNGNLAQALASFSPLATLLFWLGPINILLGVFNLVPGFPLDGGRVLRALIWGVTGNLHNATRTASRAGRMVAWLLIGVGVLMLFGLYLPWLGGGLMNGLWLIFIGWFLNSAAVISYKQLLIKETLEHVPVSRLMHTRLVYVTPHTSVQQLMDDHMMSGEQHALPVEDRGRFLGLISMANLRKAERSAWRSTRACDIMTPAAKLTCATPGEDAAEALRDLARSRVKQLPVIDNGSLIGLLRREDLLRWLALHASRQ